MKIIFLIVFVLFSNYLHPHDIVYETTHLNKLVSLNTSSDGNYFITASRSGNIKIWHRNTLKLVRIHKHNQPLVFSDFYKNDIIFNLYENSSFSFYSISNDSVVFKGQFNDRIDIEVGFIDGNNKLLFANKSKIIVYDLVEILNNKIDKIEYVSNGEMTNFHFNGTNLSLYYDSKICKYDFKLNKLIPYKITVPEINSLYKTNTNLVVQSRNKIDIYNTNGVDYKLYESIEGVNDIKSDEDKIYSLNNNELKIYDEYGDYKSSIKTELENVYEYYVNDNIVIFYDFKNYEIEMHDISKQNRKTLSRRFGENYRIYTDENNLIISENNNKLHQIDLVEGDYLHFNNIQIINGTERVYINDSLSISNTLVKYHPIDNNLKAVIGDTKVYENDDASFRILNPNLNVDLTTYDLSGDFEIINYKNHLYLNDRLFGLYKVVNNNLTILKGKNNLNVFKIDNKLYVFDKEIYSVINLDSEKEEIVELKSSFAFKRIYRLDKTDTQIYLVTNNNLFKLDANNYSRQFTFDLQGQIIDYKVVNKLAYLVSNMGELIIFDIKKDKILRRIYLSKDGEWIALDENDNFDGTDELFENLNVVIDNYPMDIDNYISQKYIPRLLALNYDYESKSLTSNTQKQYEYEISRINEIKVLRKNYDTLLTKKANIPVLIRTQHKIKELNVYLNGKLFKYNYYKIPIQVNSIYNYQFLFESGHNSIEFQAISVDDIKSNKIKIDVFSKTEKQKPILYVLGIGNNQYEGMPDLNWPEKDVNDMSASLSDNNNYYKEVKVSTINKNYSKENIITEIKSIRDVIRPEDTFLFYYSGHGYYSIDDGFSLFSNDGLININYILTNFLDFKSSNIVFMFDACYSGGAIDNLLEFTRALRLYQNKTKISLFSSSYSYQESYEIPKYKNGLFTSVMLDLLNKDLNSFSTNKKYISTYDLDYHIKEKYLDEMKSFNSSLMNFNDPIIFSQSKVILK